MQKEKKKFQIIDMRRYDDFPKPLRRRKYIFVFSMLILSVISWAVFYVYLNFSSIIMAFKEFVGYENGKEIYRWSFANFERFWSEMTYDGWATASFKAALENTLFFYFLGTLWSFPTMFIVSYYIYKKFAGYRLYRVILYMPSIISGVVMVTITKNIVEANGLISALSVAFGGEMVTGLLTTEELAKWTLLCYNNWVGFAGAYIVLTGAMNRIPMEIIESAQLEGIGKMREFWQIIVPLIWPTLHIILLTKITSVFAAEAPILLFTGGAYDTYTIGFWYYDQVILSHSFEYPAAVGLIMTLFLTPISIIARKLLDKVYDDVEF